MTTADPPRTPYSGSVLPRGWDAAFYALTTVAAASVLVAEGDGPRQTLLSISAVAVLMVAYPLLGRRGLIAGDQRRTRAYLILLVAVVALCAGTGSSGMPLLFVGCSQVWLLSPSSRSAIAWCAALAVTVTVGVGTADQPVTATDLPVMLGQIGVVVVFSLAMAWWLAQVGRSRSQREELLHRLRAAEAELAAGHHAAGVLAERARVAQEIHDTVAQGFTSVVMLAQTAQAQVEHGSPEAAAERMDQIEAVARENLTEARALVAALGPSGLMDEDLPTALRRMAARLERGSGVRVRVEVVGAAPGDRELQVVLLRTAREALNNVRRHASASTVELRLCTIGDRVALTVVDDGRGLPAGTADGVGLRGMRQRVAAAGGTVRVENAGPGVRVLAELPLPVEKGVRR